MGSDSSRLQTFHFDMDFEVVVEPEFPGSGDWGCDVVGFQRDGSVQEPFDSVWGPPFIVEVLPHDGSRWVGQYAAGGLGGLTGAYACPSPKSLAVVADGQAYLTSVIAPRAGSQIIHDQVHQVVPVQDSALLLFVRFIDIVAVGSKGIAWRTRRLAVDDLHVVRATADTIECTLDNLGGSDTITLDPLTGDQLTGTRLDSFWPPDALA